MADLLARAYELVHHDNGCRAIGGNGDADCDCDAVPFLRELERALAAQPAPDVWKEEAERLGTCIEIAIKKMREPVEYLEQALREHKNYLLTDGKSHG